MHVIGEMYYNLTVWLFGHCFIYETGIKRLNKVIKNPNFK